MRISDWSSDVCSSDLSLREELAEAGLEVLPQDVVVYSIEGPFFFGSVDSLERALSWTRKPPRHVVLRLERVPFIDATGLKRLESTIDKLRKRGIAVVPTGAHLPGLSNVIRAKDAQGEKRSGTGKYS